MENIIHTLHDFMARRDNRNRPYSWARFTLNGDEPEELGRADTSTEE